MFCWAGVAPFEQMHPVCGHEYMLMGMALDPEWVSDMVQTYADFTIRHLELLFIEPPATGAGRSGHILGQGPSLPAGREPPQSPPRAMLRRTFGLAWRSTIGQSAGLSRSGVPAVQL